MQSYWKLRSKGWICHSNSTMQEKQRPRMTVPRSRVPGVEDCPPRTEGFTKGLVGNSSPPLFNLENRDPMEPLLYGAPFPAANTLPANNVFTIVFVNIHSNSQWLVRIRECTSRVSVWMCVCNVSVCVSWVATSCDIGKALKLIKKFLYWTQ